MANAVRIAPVETPESILQYELRVRRHGPADTEYAIWQIPSPAVPHLTFARRVARLRGPNLDLIEHRVLRLLAQSGVRLGPNAGDANSGYTVPEEVALVLGLLFRALAPMKNRANMRAVVEGIETMRHEEAAYWAGMAIHRKHPRRVLMALRILLTATRPEQDGPRNRPPKALPVSDRPRNMRIDPVPSTATRGITALGAHADVTST